MVLVSWLARNVVLSQCRPKAITLLFIDEDIMDYADSLDIRLCYLVALTRMVTSDSDLRSQSPSLILER